jgi:pimeloyl-ACP methyl ester carboxylesterase
LCLAAVCAYAGLLVVLMALEDRLLYHPNRHKGMDWRPPPADLPVRDVWLSTKAGRRIHAWWHARPGARRAVLYCHGNAGNLSHHAQPIAALARILDAAVLTFDYPGYGQSEGAPSEEGCYAAADAAYDWLVGQVPAERIVLLGQSLGGGVATDLASRRPHQVLALFKTFTSIPDVAQRQLPFVPARWLVHNRFDNGTKIDRCGAAFIGHGACDHLIPLAQAQRLFDAAQEPKRFFLMKGCGHHGTLAPDFLAGLADFLETLDAARQPSSANLSVQDLTQLLRIHLSS